MLSAQDAEAKILELVQTLNPATDQEQVALENSLGRILAAAISSPLDFPYWDNSAMDGYAVRSEDLERCSPQNPVSLNVVMEIPAGCAPSGAIAPGEAARIFTGAMVPPGANTIVMQEQTQRDGDQVWILERPKPKDWIRAKGDYHRAGSVLLPAGTPIYGPEIAILATAQYNTIPVYRRVRVSILSTGNELITPDQPLGQGQIIDSNQPALAALLQQMGVTVQRLGIIPDHPADLSVAIATALEQSDLVISSGGVSVGDYDYVDQILAQLGGTLHIQSVAIKPGKPLTVASFPNRDPNCQRPILYFGLPGNPVSAPVGFWRFIQPALRKLSGQTEGWGPMFVRAKTAHPLKTDGKRETYIWGNLSLNGEGIYTFTAAGGTQSSGNLINLARTNGLAALTCDRAQIEAGEWVRVMQVGHG